MDRQRPFEPADLDLDTEVFLALVCKVPLSAVEYVKRLLAAHGSRIVYQRLAAEPLRVVTQREFDALRCDDDCRTVP
jgi:hypothetical protein